MQIRSLRDKRAYLLQERLNLAQDGIAGYNSIQAVFYN